MNRRISKLIYVLAIICLILSCETKNEENLSNPLTGFIKLNEGYVQGASAKVEIWGKKNFFVGYNNLVVVLYDSLNLNEKITDAHIHFLPVMTMGMGDMQMQHASPVESPEEEAINEVFPGAIAFIMATNPEGSWKLGISVHNHKYDKEGKAEFDITVDNPSTSVLTVFTSQCADSSKLILSLLEPTKPKVGMNEIEFTIHRMADMMDFPPDDSYTIEITPEMPSMGHGSPNNVNPVSKGNGHYKGKVNFTMTGEWRVNVAVKKDDNTVSKNIYFNITF
jgi:hypothetical protein